jgi:hypothetical protein
MSPKEAKEAVKKCLYGITGGFMIGSIRVGDPITWETALTVLAGGFLLLWTFFWLVDTYAIVRGASEGGPSA